MELSGYERSGLSVSNPQLHAAGTVSLRNRIKAALYS